nr:g-type lectin s-receptor-like serine/threonine-protein kinase [Quercus suber]
MASMDDIPTCKFSHHVFLPMLLVLCPLFHSSHAARDTISQRQSITITETIVSADAEFELGFLRPGRNSTNQYVGIWFKKVSLQTITWVANRDHPITSSTAVLTISNDGNLVIMDGRLSYMVSNLPSYANASATLLDSGNLVLRDENSKILWQSFDFPSHTLLPGMKLGLLNCSCTGCALNDYNCSIWIGDLINLQHLTDDDHSARDFYVKVATPMQSPKTFIWWMWVRKLKRKGEDLISFDFNNRSTQQGLVNMKGAEKGRNKEMELPLFSFSSVSAATNNFAASNKLGEGGFGPVYKGSLLNGQFCTLNARQFFPTFSVGMGTA